MKLDELEPTTNIEQHQHSYNPYHTIIFNQHWGMMLLERSIVESKHSMARYEFLEME